MLRHVIELAVRRAFFPDSRGDDQFLRVTWHPCTTSIVVSHWAGSICVASTVIPLDSAPDLIGLLVGALSDAATSARTDGAPTPPDEPTLRSMVARRIRQRLRPTLAPIIKLTHKADKLNADREHLGS
jgi:hypothetical protein